MKELELLAIERLIIVYSELNRTGITSELTKKTELVYLELTPGSTLLSDPINSAVGKLFSVAYPNIDQGRKVPSKEEIKEIILSLRTRMKELEK
jgi:hypothetical protein